MMKTNEPRITDNRNKQFPAVDMIKIICAIFVVSLHVSPFGNDENGLLLI